MCGNKKLALHTRVENEPQACIFFFSSMTNFNETENTLLLRIYYAKIQCKNGTLFLKLTDRQINNIIKSNKIEQNITLYIKKCLLELKNSIFFKFDFGTSSTVKKSVIACPNWKS